MADPRKPASQGPGQPPGRPAPVFETLQPPPAFPPPAKGAGGKAGAGAGASAGASTVTPASDPPPPPRLQNAVAVSYESSAGAPKIVAKGRGLVAEQIIARAREHGVFVHESKELVALLMQVELDDHIPPTLYRAVAELLAWLYRIEAARSGIGKVS